MRGSAKVLTVLATMAALMVAAPTTQAAFPGQNGRIAAAVYEWVGHLPGLPDIYTLNPDGSGSTALTTDDTSASSSPAWSPDGSKIAFDRRFFDTGNYDIYTMNADGSGVVELTTSSAVDVSPAWSPDGSKIAFASDRSGNFDIYTMNADGSGVTQITTNPQGEHSPSWSPSGDEIAFDRLDQSIIEIHAVGVDGTGERLIVGSQSANPNWSPDGRRIAFDDGSEVWVVNADGSGRVQVTFEPPNPNAFTFNLHPAWSPDGEKIVFEQGACGFGFCVPPHLWMVNADGTGRTSVSSGGEPDWQPLTGPQRSDYKNAAQFCKAEREFLGDSGFSQKYGGGGNAHGKCVSGK